MKLIGFIASILVLFGAINWGLVGMLNMDLVVKIFGARTLATKITYDLIGVSAILALLGYTRK